MSSQAPSPTSSDDVSDNQSDGSNAPPPKSSSRSPGSASDGNDDSSNPSPPSPGSGGSRSSPSSDSQDSSSSNSKGSWSPPSSKSSPSPSSSPSTPSPPVPPSDSSPSPPTRSPPPQQSEDAKPPPSSSSPQSPPSPSRSSPPSSPPRWSSSNDGQSGSPPPSGGQPSPSASASPPPPPANHSVVFIPIVSSNHPGAPPGLVAIAPPGSVGVMSDHLPGAQSGTPGGMQTGPSSSTSSSSSQLHSSQAVNGQLAAAIAGAAVAGLLFVMIAIFFVITRSRRKKDGFVYHTDGSYYMHSGQLVGSNHPSGVFYGPPPPGASGGFSYGPLATPGPPGTTDSFRGAGYYRSGSLEQQQQPPGSYKSSFSYDELTSITSNFARDNVIGEGGFGCVYKGWLADGKCVAVKQLKAGSGQGEREFQAEVEIISRVHHRHLVSLVGYCIAQHHRMLIYEFVPNGTLEHHLHGRGVPVMDWPTRLRIAIGAAKGLAYLHEDCHPRIIHRDIKSANIHGTASFPARAAPWWCGALASRPGVRGVAAPVPKASERAVMANQIEGNGVDAGWRLSGAEDCRLPVRHGTLSDPRMQWRSGGGAPAERPRQLRRLHCSCRTCV